MSWRDLAGDAFDVVGNVATGVGRAVERTVEKAVDDPVGVAVRSVTSPITNALEVVEGLAEGELRLKAIALLGADIAVGMGASEILELVNDAGLLDELLAEISED